MGVYCALILCVFLFDGVAGDAVVRMTVMEGESVPLFSAVTKTQQDKMLWYFNDTLIALINGEESKSCVYYGEGEIFKDRLQVDYETGSLTITNIRPEHTGLYEANFIQIKSSGTSLSLDQNRKCDGTKTIRKRSNIGDSVKTFIVSVTASLSKSTAESFHMENEQEPEKKSVQSLSLVIGICSGVGVVLPLVAAVLVVIYCRHRSSNKEDTKEERTESSSEQLLKIPV